jgi:L-amino acid N-acyltransferase YncA
VIREVVVVDADALSNIHTATFSRQRSVSKSEPSHRQKSLIVSKRLERPTCLGSWQKRNGVVAGYAYATEWKGRSAYRFRQPLLNYRTGDRSPVDEITRAA